LDDGSAPARPSEDELLFDDRGLLLGDGLFETVLADGGRLVRFDDHRRRLERGCEVVGLPSPARDRLRKAAEAALAPLGGVRAAVRLTWTAGSGGRGLDRPGASRPRLLASARPAPAPAGPLALAIAGVRRNDRSPTSQLKSLAYLDNVLARREARATGADEALMLNTRDEVACAAAANVFWIDDGHLFTPALSCGVLDGTMRAAVLRAAAAMGQAVAEIHARPQALDQAEAIFLTNSLIGVRAVCALDGRPIGAHALTARLAQACAAVAP
jgi:branched-chain amino acid aminotransferase/4-amino-4-deoxychorismate lyase